jgi:hypothetical protein
VFKVTLVPELNTVADGQRLRMLSQEVQAALEAIARVQASLDSELPADKRIKLEVEVVETTRIVPTSAQLDSWSTAQENWGGYDADDHVFRGPYIGSVTILPTHTATDIEAEIFQHLRDISTVGSEWANRWEN